jgi:hypothetical protein
VFEQRRTTRRRRPTRRSRGFRRAGRWKGRALHEGLVRRSEVKPDARRSPADAARSEVEPGCRRRRPSGRDGSSSSTRDRQESCCAPTCSAPPAACACTISGRRMRSRTSRRGIGFFQGSSPRGSAEEILSPSQDARRPTARPPARRRDARDERPVASSPRRLSSRSSRSNRSLLEPADGDARSAFRTAVFVLDR